MTALVVRLFVDHWRGHHRWPLTLLVSVIGATYLYYAALLQLPAVSPYIAIPFWVIAGCLLLGWQVGGTLAAIKADLAQPSDISAAYGGYFTIFVAVVLVGVKMMDGVTRHLPKPAAGPLLSSSQFYVSLDQSTASVILRGEVNYASHAALVDLLKRHPATKRVVLNSAGGHIFAARTIARDIQRLGLNTHSDGHCFSACTIVFMGGAKRSLGPDGRLGFHRYAFANRFAVQTVNAVAEQQKDLEFFLSRGVSANFLARVFDAGHDSLWQPDHTTLAAASVLTEAPR